MLRLASRLAVVLVPMLIGACAEVETHDAGTPPDAKDGEECWSAPFHSVSFGYREADVLILFDRSGSMDIAFGPGTRYEKVAAELAVIVQKYARRVRFGFEEMPGRQGCGDPENASCCASPPIVPVAAANSGPVLDALAAALPMEGSTPTAGALRAARDYYQALDDGVTDRYVLLVTDGLPSCDISGALTGSSAYASLSAACAAALAEVNELVRIGARVAVLGIGSSLVGYADGATACLDALAQAGGAAASPGSPAFFGIANMAELHDVMAQTFGGVADPSCDLVPTLLPDDMKGMRVLFDGEPIREWRPKPLQKPSAIEITEPACGRLRRFEVSTIELRMPCAVSST